jgi:hypothetical protein
MAGGGIMLGDPNEPMASTWARTKAIDIMTHIDRYIYAFTSFEIQCLAVRALQYGP